MSNITVVKEGVRKDQVEWYLNANLIGHFTKVPMSYVRPLGTLHMPFVKAIPLACTDWVDRLPYIFYQIELWSKRHVPSSTYTEYVASLAARLDAIKDNELVHRTLALLNEHPLPDSTWCHGDLTLENVLVDKDTMYLIDPNPRQFWSHWLDYGKLAFSLEYHERFGSFWLHASMKNELARRLDALDWPTLRSALISHIIRLQGYKNVTLIERWLRKVVCAGKDTVLRRH